MIVTSYQRSNLKQACLLVTETLTCPGVFFLSLPMWFLVVHWPASPIVRIARGLALSFGIMFAELQFARLIALHVLLPFHCLKDGPVYLPLLAVVMTLFKTTQQSCRHVKQMQRRGAWG